MMTEVTANKDFISFFNLEGNRIVVRRSLLLSANLAGGGYDQPDSKTKAIIQVNMGTYTAGHFVSVSTLDQIAEWMMNPDAE